MVAQGSEPLLKLDDTLIIPLLHVQEIRLNPDTLSVADILTQEERLNSSQVMS